MKKNLFLFLLLIPFYWFADCSLSTSQPNVVQDWEVIDIEWMVQWACSDSINEFKVYYLDWENWSPITTVLAWKNKAKYSVKWDISNISSWSYKVRVLQYWDNQTYVTTDSFLIDKTPPVIRNDVWLLPSWWEVMRWDIVIKWNSDSISDDYKLWDKPVSFYYSFDNESYTPLIEWFENSWIFVAKTSEITSDKVYLKIQVKDSNWNESFKILSKTFSIDNEPPLPAKIKEVDWLSISDNMVFNTTPSVTIWDIDFEDNLRVVVFDKDTEKVFSSSSSLDSEELTVQLSPMSDWDYELWIITIDTAWNSTKSDFYLKFSKDSFPPTAPSVSYAAMVNNNLRVSAWDISEEWWEFILMNWDDKLAEQSVDNKIFNISPLPQWIYNLYLLHKDNAWNISDKSNEKKVVFDTAPPRNVRTSIPWSSIYWDFNLKLSAIDNVWIDKFAILVDWKEVWKTGETSFTLKTKDFSNWSHELKLIAHDFWWNTSESQVYSFKTFNSLIEWHWANSYIKDLFDQWILSWESDSWIIDPERQLNRASALKLITTFFDKDIELSSLSDSYFSDVESWVWYEWVVNSSYKNWIIEWFKEKHKLKEIVNSFEDNEVKNLQFVLKWLSFNLKITWNYDDETVRAVANYQNSKWLQPTWNIWLNTLFYLNNEEIVKNWEVIENDIIYFRPWDMVNRVQALKMILIASWINIPEKSWDWYEKYTSFAKKNWIMTWNDKWDLMLEKWVTVWEMSKMLLKTRDLISD